MASFPIRDGAKPSLPQAIVSFPADIVLTKSSPGSNHPVRRTKNVGEPIYFLAFDSLVPLVALQHSMDDGVSGVRASTTNSLAVVFRVFRDPIRHN